MKKILIFILLSIFTFTVEDEKVNNIINNTLNSVTTNNQEETKKQEENTTEEEKPVKEEIDTSNLTIEELSKYKESLDSNNPEEVYTLARLYANFGLYESAYNIAMLDKSGDLRNMYVAATAARKIGDYKKSIDLYNKILKVNPSHLKSVLGIGLAYRGLGEIKTAISYLENYNSEKHSEEVSILINELRNLKK